MSIVTSGGIVVLATLILAFLQLGPGIFALFSHYASGRFTAKKRAMLTTFFMLGVETVSAILFICSVLFVNIFFYFSPRPEATFLAWILVGFLLALAIFSIIGYYRSSSGSQLFISRKSAAALARYAAETSTRSDAFVLGAFSSVLELPFSLPLYLAAASSIVVLSVLWPSSLLLAFLFVCIPLLPLFFVRYKFRLGFNLADIMRSRVRDKNFVRFVLCFAYTTIAVLIIINYFF